MPAILIVGGYGAFGLKVAERLAREAGIEVILAGRSASRAQAAAADLARNSLAAIGHAAIDAVAPDRVALASLARGEVQRPQQVQPVYVRDEINWKKLAEQGKKL